MPHRPALLLTAALLLVLLGLGLGLQLRRFTVGRSWHHRLYFAVVAGTGLSSLLAWRAGAAWFSLLPAQALLLLMPLTKPGRAGHWQLALASALAFGLGLWGAW